MKSDDLELLTVQLSDDSDALLGTTSDTSAATAGAARMAAILQSEYPGFWPETIRALMIHSAEWTPQMIREFPQNRRKERLRVYGMGVPNLDRARRSVENFATMVIQDQIQPYYLDGKDAKTNEMHLHELPLPVRVLQDMGSIPIQMRVTLSYFIEPNPPRRGYVAQFRYPSHGLRFSLIRPGENTDRFLTRLTSSVWPEENQSNRKSPENTVKDDRNWVLGEKTAVRGSIHSDAWNGTAAELAQSSRLAIYPVTGWWRERSRLGFVNKKARYSLVISISTADESIKLYSLVSSQIQAMATTPISVVVE